MSTNLANLLYLIPIATFILALRFLSNPAHARRGNQIGAAGMLVAIVVTWIRAGGGSWWALVVAMLVGGGLGAVGAQGADDGDAADGGALQRRRRRSGGAHRARRAAPLPAAARTAAHRRARGDCALGFDRRDLLRRVDGRVREAPGADRRQADHVSGPECRQHRAARRARCVRRRPLGGCAGSVAALAGRRRGR